MCGRCWVTWSSASPPVNAAKKRQPSFSGSTRWNRATASGSSSTTTTSIGSLLIGGALAGLGAAEDAVLQVGDRLRHLAHLEQEVLVRLGDLLEQRRALDGRPQLGRGVEHALAQVGHDLGLLEHHVDRAAPERLDRGVERPAVGHHDHRHQRRLVARELQQLEPAARRGRVDVEQRDREVFVQDLVARPPRIAGPGHGQPHARQQPVEPLHDLLVAVHDQDLLAGGGCGNVSHSKKLLRFGTVRESPAHFLRTRHHTDHPIGAAGRH